MDTLSSFFGSKRKFKGQGHKLGSGEPSSSTPKKSSAPTASNGPIRQPAASSSAGTSRPSSSVPPRQLDTPSTDSPALPQTRAVPSHQQASPREIPAPSNTAASRLQQGAHQQLKTAPVPSEAPLSSTQLPVAADNTLLARDAMDGSTEDASDEVQHAVALLHSDEQGAEAAATLLKLLGNISQDPGDPKFRRIRLSNARIQKAVVDVSGGLELLQACGFEIVFEDDAEGATGDGFAVLAEEHDLHQLRAALELLKPLAPTRSELGPSHAKLPKPKPQPVANLAEPCERKTQVLLPAETDGRNIIPDWVFKRTPAEVKEQLLAARKKREQSEMLMTRAMREKLNVKDRPRYTEATVRVRLPEGLLLQGQFSAGEPVANVLNWVTDCLADPGTTYELVLPDRKPLVTSMGTVRSADLLPSVLLNFRRDGLGAGQTLTLRPEIMALATPNTGA